MQVKAKVDHYDSAQTYRKAGEVFEHNGKLHEHIEPVKGAKAAEGDLDAKDGK
jgi:hypothetical protein